MCTSKICRVVVAFAIAAICLTASVRPARSATTEVTLTGTVSCAHCQGIQPMHKGYTQFSWALYSVSQGDDIVLVVRDRAYNLQGEKDQLLKFMSAKVTVTGQLEGTTLAVERIGRAAKNQNAKGNGVNVPAGQA